MRLTENEKIVLTLLVEGYDTSGWKEFGYYSFAPICKKTNLARRQVRLACRSLARKGLAEFCRGLVTEDGEMAGAGYGATKEGALLIIPCVDCGKEIQSFTDGRCEECWQNRKCANCGKAYREHELKNGYKVEFVESTTPLTASIIGI